MAIESLISTNTELMDRGEAEPIVLSARIRLARNLVDFPFPGRAKVTQKREIMSRVFEALSQLPAMQEGEALELENLSNLEKQVIFERHLISRELTESKSGSGVFIAKTQDIAVMVNEEDHLRLQMVRSGFNLQALWDDIDHFDTALESHLDYAFDRHLGYLTACPTNLGTGMRASAMLHLPGLVMAGHMEKVVRMVNQLGMAVRGLFGEGSNASGNIFQISNQQTLGESEQTIIKRLVNVLKAIIEQEKNARLKLLEDHPEKIYDKIGRAFGILQNGHLLSSEEAMNYFSLLRLAVDLGMIKEEYRNVIDRLLIEAQPGHIQYEMNDDLEAAMRDVYRARKVRQHFAPMPPPRFPATV